jgi:hypothetical protein
MSIQRVLMYINLKVDVSVYCLTCKQFSLTKREQNGI